MILIKPYTVVDASLISSNVPETDHAAWAVGTTYAQTARVIVIGTNSHKVYESLQASNVGRTPASSPTWWLDIGATNRWDMFDQSVQSQTSNATSINVSIKPAQRVDTVTLLNISASATNIIMYDTSATSNRTVYKFAGSVPAGVLSTNCTASTSDSGLTATLSASTGDSNILIPGLSLNPATNYLIYVKVKIPVGTYIDGSLFFSNTLHSTTEATKLQMGDYGLAATGEWQEITMDLRTSTSDWMTGGTISGVRFDFIGQVADIVIDSIIIGNVPVVYNKITNLASYSGIDDWYDYIYEPVARRTDFIANDLPPYSNATIQVILNETGGTAYCGGLIVGQQTFLGNTQYGSTVGIQDYSLKTQDAFGNYSILQRAFRKTGNFQIQLASNHTDQLMALLTSLRAMPIIYSGSSDFSAMIIYGFYKDLSVNIAYPEVSLCTLTIEGLT